MMRLFVFFGLLALCAACGRSDVSGNRTLSTGPDPFSVLPSKPLEDPANFQTLPTPRPGGVNRADVNPVNDAAQALGGRAAGAGIPSSDQALVTHVSRNGRDADIRADLANQRGGGLFGGSMALDAYAELERFRALGVTTPTAPPSR